MKRKPKYIPLDRPVLPGMKPDLHNSFVPIINLDGPNTHHNLLNIKPVKIVSQFRDDCA